MRQVLDVKWLVLNSFGRGSLYRQWVVHCCAHCAVCSIQPCTACSPQYAALHSTQSAVYSNAKEPQTPVLCTWMWGWRTWFYVRLGNLVIHTHELESYDNKGTRSHDYKGGILQVLCNKSHVITKIIIQLGFFILLQVGNNATTPEFGILMIPLCMLISPSAIYT